jgi:hypothetical protein
MKTTTKLVILGLLGGIFWWLWVVAAGLVAKQTAENGGMSLLTNLHQIELADEIDRLESELGIANTEETGS